MKTLRLMFACALLLFATVVQAQVRVHYINVGQADSILLEFRTAAILIDAGGETVAPPNQNRDRDHLIDYLNRFFANRAAPNSTLPNLNRTLLAVIISHPHVDHTRNIMPVMGAFRVQNLIDGGNDSGSGITQLNAARTFARDNNIRYAAIRDNTITTTNGLIPFPELMTSSQVDLRILGGSRGCDNENNDSIIVLVRFRQASFLFTGDAELEGGSDCDGEVPILMDFYRTTNLLNVDVYKVGHHASFNGTDEDFMRVMSPKISVISAGIHTQHGPGGFHAFQFGHPRTVTVDLLERFSSMLRPPVNVYSMLKVRRVVPRVMRRAVYCTCWDGDIRVFTSNANGSQLRVQTSGRPDGNAPNN
jgi:competence protein ComEC